MAPVPSRKPRNEAGCGLETLSHLLLAPVELGDEGSDEGSGDHAQGGKNRMPTIMPAVAPREAYFVPPVTRVSQPGTT